jgi:acyl-coenzyme A thioesterase PaaI-like protein
MRSCRRAPSRRVSRLQAWAARHPRTFRHVLNWYPCYRGTGGKVTHIAPDWSEMRVRLRLGWRTRNYVGTIYGGSLYACVDPHFMFMLMHRLGPGYTVWDKAASIRFRRPGRSTLTAVCRLPDAEVEEVRRLLETEPKVDRTYQVDLVDAAGVVHARVEKVVNVRRKGAREEGPAPVPDPLPAAPAGSGRALAKA